MKMFIKNCFHLQFSTDVEDSHGEMIRVLIQPGETARIDNVDPFYINQDKLFRDEVKFLCAGVQTGEELLVWFECEDTDLVAFNAKICLPGGVAECGQLLVADECGTFRPIGPGADGDVLIWDAAEPNCVKFGPAATALTIEDEGTPIGSKTILDFVGAGVTAVNVGGGRARITIPGGGATAIVEFGADSVGSSPTDRYLYAGYAERLAEVVPHFWTAPRAGTLRNMYVRHNKLGGNANIITYRVRVNTVATVLIVTLAANATVAFNTTDTVAVAAGDRIDLQVVKTINVGSSPRNVIATMEVA